MSEAVWTIGELAAAAEVTPRTIRYYTAEGLLPPPETRGKYALYGGDHLRRLRLIARLKAAYLPLNEIRARIEQLTPDQVAQLLGEYHHSQDEPAPTRAADYIAQVLQNRMVPPPARIVTSEKASPAQGPEPFASEAPLAQTATRYGNMPAPDPAMPMLQTGDMERADPPGGSMLSRLVSQPARSNTPVGLLQGSLEQRETWQRVTLAPGVELHIQEPAAPGLRERIAELIHTAGQIFSDEKRA
jgi:DNA-binding transcriptional MerR regulator